mgnify:CR=1 FL=1
MADQYLNKTVLTYFYNRLKTVFAEMTATAYENRNPDTRAVSNIEFFNYCIIHILPLKT